MPNDNNVTDEQKLRALEEAEERKKAQRALDPNRKRNTP